VIDHAPPLRGRPRFADDDGSPVQFSPSLEFTMSAPSCLSDLPMVLDESDVDRGFCVEQRSLQESPMDAILDDFVESGLPWEKFVLMYDVAKPDVAAA
jgi:hypothetical protein